jgi:hypothetical protein
MPVHIRHDTRNHKVEIVSLLPHGEGEAMVHICHGQCELSCIFPMSHIGSVPRAMLEFEQPEKESIGLAWA